MAPFPLEALRRQLAGLTAAGIYIGTSSWKYEGWLGLIYTPERYTTRGKFSRAFKKIFGKLDTKLGAGRDRNASHKG